MRLTDREKKLIDNLRCYRKDGAKVEVEVKRDSLKWRRIDKPVKIK